jgi:hypothetical protein
MMRKSGLLLFITVVFNCILVMRYMVERNPYFNPQESFSRGIVYISRHNTYFTERKSATIYLLYLESSGMLEILVLLAFLGPMATL